MIVDVVRTPRGKGKPGGALSGIHPQELLAGVFRELEKRTGLDPAEVEAALSEHPQVVSSAVVGIADPSWGETVGASAQLSGGAGDPKELEAFLAERLAHFKIPRVWRFVSEFPMTASGKIRRVVVKDEMNAAQHSLGLPRSY